MLYVCDCVWLRALAFSVLRLRSSTRRERNIRIALYTVHIFLCRSKVLSPCVVRRAKHKRVTVVLNMVRCSKACILCGLCYMGRAGPRKCPRKIPFAHLIKHEISHLKRWTSYFIRGRRRRSKEPQLHEPNSTTTRHGFGVFGHSTTHDVVRCNA